MPNMAKRKDDEAALQSGETKQIENMLPEEFDTLFETTPLNDDTTCGFWLFRGLMQKFASKKAYVLIYGATGCMLAGTYAYFNGTITTIEKRYRIPSRNTGIISTGNDMSSALVSAILSYYGGKGHRPRWMAMGLLALVIFCFMNVLPHLLYGAGPDALLLTKEYESDYHGNNSTEFLENEKRKLLCSNKDATGAHCDMGDASWAPQIILFVAQLISGVGQTVYSTLGTTYMDDNIQKEKSATFLSISYFMRLLGPAMGYTMASFFLKLFIEPSLTPTITNKDPRWLGAWWIGWLVLGIPMLIAVPFLAMFPKSLPRSAVRKIIHTERMRRELSVVEEQKVEKASLKDMMVTFKRLLHNRTYLLNTISGIFYVFGYMPYWTYTPKYLETQYHQSASTASLVTGTVAFAFSAIGILLAGVAISRFKPNARSMVTWNVVVGMVTVCGMLTYSLLGCPVNERSQVISTSGSSGSSISRLDGATCNSNCSCDYVKYSPVCGEDGRTHISACHAGCRDEIIINDKKIYTQCACVTPNRTSPLYEMFTVTTNNTSTASGRLHQLFGVPPLESLSIATAGPCPVNCYNYFVAFLAVMCLLKFMAATGRATGFLVGVRCVEEKDKSVSLGLNTMIMCIFTMVPSPIFFGYLMDRNCLVWGKTCSGKGNCWLYNSDTLRYSLNTIAASCVFVSVLFDMGVWYYAKDLKMYDDEPTADVRKKKKPSAADGKGVELTELTTDGGGDHAGNHQTTGDADVMLSYKSNHRGSDVCI